MEPLQGDLAQICLKKTFKEAHLLQRCLLELLTGHLAQMCLKKLTCKLARDAIPYQNACF